MTPLNRQEQEPIEGEIIEPAEKNLSAPNPLLPMDPKKTGIFIGTLNVMATPAKAIGGPLHRHYHRRYHSKYKHAKKIFALDLFLVGAAVALLAIAIYFFLLKPEKNYIDVHLKDSQVLTVGAPQDITLQISNTDSHALRDVLLTFNFSKSFAVSEYPVNYNKETSSLLLNLLKEKETIELRFKVTPWGALLARDRVIINSRFTNTKDNQTSSGVSSVDFSLNNSALEVGWVLPDTIKVGQTFHLQINYKNKSSEALAKIVLIPTLPRDFAITASTQDLAGGRWVVNNVPAGADKIISLSGYIQSGAREGNMALSLQSFVEHDGSQYLQSSLIKNVSVIDNGLALDFKVSGGKTYFIPGEDGSVEIHYKNNNLTAIKDVILELKLPPTIAPTRFQSLKLDKSTNPELASLAPGAEGVAALSFKLSPTITAEAAPDQSFTVQLRPNAVFYSADEPAEVIRAFAAPQDFKISTVLTLHSEARYFTDEGDQLGRGPLPPRVGQTTKYWITWFITTSPNPVKGVLVSGKLAPGVTWTGKTNVAEGEPVRYDPVTRTVSWNNDSAQTTPGNTCPCPNIGFEVAITPTSDDVGKTLDLVRDLQITGTDIYTAEVTQKSAANLTTDLKTDAEARGKGAVQP